MDGPIVEANHKYAISWQDWGALMGRGEVVLYWGTCAESAGYYNLSAALFDTGMLGLCAGCWPGWLPSDFPDTAKSLHDVWVYVQCDSLPQFLAYCPSEILAALSDVQLQLLRQAPFDVLGVRNG